MIYTGDLPWSEKLRVWRDILLYRLGCSMTSRMLVYSEPHMVPRKGCKCLGCTNRLTFDPMKFQE